MHHRCGENVVTAFGSWQPHQRTGGPRVRPSVFFPKVEWGGPQPREMIVSAHVFICCIAPKAITVVWHTVKGESKADFLSYSWKFKGLGKIVSCVKADIVLQDCIYCEWWYGGLEAPYLQWTCIELIHPPRQRGAVRWPAHAYSQRHGENSTCSLMLWFKTWLRMAV